MDVPYTEVAHAQLPYIAVHNECHQEIVHKMEGYRCPYTGDMLANTGSEDGTYCITCGWESPDVTRVHPPPRDLSELCDYMEAGIVWYGAPLIQGVIDPTALPTFGGPRPPAPSSELVWSWSEYHYLIETPDDPVEFGGYVMGEGKNFCRVPRFSFDKALLRREDGR